MPSGCTPISTEARGRLRQWKRHAPRRYERVIQVFNSDAFGEIGTDFREKLGVGHLPLPREGQASQYARMVVCSAFALEYPRAAAAALMP